MCSGLRGRVGCFCRIFETAIFTITAWVIVRLLPDLPSVLFPTGGGLCAGGMAIRVLNE